jgi:hypothetical protein
VATPVESLLAAKLVEEQPHSVLFPVSAR